MKMFFWGLLIPFIFLLSSCAISNNVEVQQERWEGKMFNGPDNTDGQQVEAIFEEMIQIIESQDHAAMKALFADSVIVDVETLDSDIFALFDAYQGEMVSYKCYGPSTHGAKQDNHYVKNIHGIFDVTTTVGVFTIGFDMCTINTNELDKVGILSVYLVSTEYRFDWEETGIYIEDCLLQEKFAAE